MSQGFTWQIQRKELSSLAVSRIHSILPVRWCGWRLWSFCILWNKEPHFYTWNHTAIAVTQSFVISFFCVGGSAGAKMYKNDLSNKCQQNSCCSAHLKLGFVHLISSRPAHFFQTPAQILARIKSLKRQNWSFINRRWTSQRCNLKMYVDKWQVSEKAINLAGRICPLGSFSSLGEGHLGLTGGGNTRAAFPTAALSYFISQDADHRLNDSTAH